MNDARTTKVISSSNNDPITVSKFRSRFVEKLKEFEVDHIYANKEDEELYPEKLTEDQWFERFVESLNK